MLNATLPYSTTPASPILFTYRVFAQLMRSQVLGALSLSANISGNFNQVLRQVLKQLTAATTITNEREEKMLWENVNERKMNEFSFCRSVNHKLTEHRSGLGLQLFKKLITFKKGCTRGVPYNNIPIHTHTHT